MALCLFQSSRNRVAENRKPHEEVAQIPIDYRFTIHEISPNQILTPNCHEHSKSDRSLIVKQMANLCGKHHKSYHHHIISSDTRTAYILNSETGMLIQIETVQIKCKCRLYVRQLKLSAHRPLPPHVIYLFLFQPEYSGL